MNISELLPGKFLKSGIGKNFVALSAWQVTNYLAPLLVMPYLIRTIGTEKFGVVSLIQAVNYYFIILVDYGFSTTAVREISVSRENTSGLAIIFSRTFFTKAIICLFSFAILAAVVFLVPRFAEYRVSYLWGFCIVIGQLTFPIWFFQGIEKMKFTTYLNALSKIIYVAGIFLLVRTPSEFSWVLPIQGLSVAVAGIAGIVIIHREFGVRVSLPSPGEILAELRKGWPVFISNISVTIYNSTLYLIVGFSVSESLLGSYSVAEKLSQVMRQVITVFSQAVYPQVCLLASQGIGQVRAFWRKMVWPFALLILPVCLATTLLAPWIVEIIAGAPDEVAATLLRMLIWVPLIVFFNIPFFQTLLAYNLNREVMWGLLGCSVVSVSMGYFLVDGLSVYGAAFTLILTEIMIVATLAVLCERKNSHSIIFN